MLVLNLLVVFFYGDYHIVLDCSGSMDFVMYPVLLGAFFRIKLIFKFKYRYLQIH